MSGNTLIFILLILLFVFIAFFKRKLTPAATLTALGIGILVYAGTGLPGILLLNTFFIISITATSWCKDKKSEFPFYNVHEKRNAWQVLANGGVAAFLASLPLLYPSFNDLSLLLLACSLSSATADTISSELGILYGKNFYNIISFKKDQKGEDGVISLEGTIAGIIGSLVISLIYAGSKAEFDFAILVIVLAGTLGNMFDSFLGALLERKHIINNDVVNFLNTAFAALIGWILSELIL